MLPSARDIVVVHSSDLHVDHDYTARLHGGDGTAGLACVLDAARAIAADVVILAGDTFDHHRLPQALIERAAAVIAAAAMPVVVLPGNHDPAIGAAVYRGAALAAVNNLHVLGVTHDEAVQFPDLSLEIWGRAHRDYGDMAPLAAARTRRTRWQVAMAHGHFEWRRDRANPLRPSWLFSEDDIDATEADYLALGHWDRAARVGDGPVPAFYSGSPELARTLNLIRLGPDGAAVERAPLARD